MSNLKFGLFYKEMNEHAEWLKHEAEDQHIDIELLTKTTDNPEDLDKYDGVIFMAFDTEKEVIKEFSYTSFVLNQIEIPFVWAVEGHKNPMAYCQLNNFAELENVSPFLTAIFDMAKELSPEKKAKTFPLIPSFKKGKTEPKEVQVSEPEEEPIQSQSSSTSELDSFGVFDELDELPVLEDLERPAPQRSQQTVPSESLFGDEDEEETNYEEFHEQDDEKAIQDELNLYDTFMDKSPEEHKPNPKNQPVQPSQSRPRSGGQPERMIDSPAFAGVQDFPSQTPYGEPSTRRTAPPKQLDSLEESPFSLFDEPKSTQDPMYYEEDETEEEEVITVTRLSNVIAVAGAGHGVGTSFVALNLAYLLKGVLMEGKTTSTLARWLNTDSVVDREGYLHGDAKGEFPVLSSKELKTNDELNVLKIKAKYKPFIVDCDVNSVVWNLAEHKIFVVSADPQYCNVNVPSNAKVVLNKMPQNFPITPSKLMGVQPDLLIEEETRLVQLSLWGKVPYLAKKPQHVREQWLNLVETNRNLHEDKTQGGEEDWNFEKHS